VQAAARELRDDAQPERVRDRVQLCEQFFTSQCPSLPFTCQINITGEASGCPSRFLPVGTGSADSPAHTAFSQRARPVRVASQTTGRFWLLQAVETATYLALAAALAGLGIWRLRRLP
jgi:hypothetical protein